MYLYRPRERGTRSQKSEYSIKDIKCAPEPTFYTVEPSKRSQTRYRPRLIIELESRRYHGGRVHLHDATLVINLYELEKMQEALSDGLLNSFHALAENDLKNRKAKNAPDSIANAKTAHLV